MLQVHQLAGRGTSVNHECLRWPAPIPGVAMTSPGFKRLMPVAALIFVMVSLLACSPREQIHGYLPDEERLAEVQKGVHDRASIEALLGSPSSVGTFEDKTWYYITRHTEKLAFFQEEVLDQKVVAIVFDDAGVVADIRQYDLSDGREIEPVDRETPTRGKELTILQQLLGNIGRFNTSEGAN